MTQRSLSCPRCGGTMEKGFLRARSTGLMGGPPAAWRPEWIEGKPEYSRWGVLKVAGKRVADPSVVYRCERCGYLEWYAPTEE